MYFWKNPESRLKYTRRVGVAFAELDETMSQALGDAQQRLDSARQRARAMLGASPPAQAAPVVTIAPKRG